MTANIIYSYGGSLYLNLTNKCPCSCSFCIRDRTQRVGSSESLWLEAEPTPAQVIAGLEETDLTRYDQIVFCGFGEPFCAFESILEISAYLRGRAGCPPIRINTNGLGDLINQRPTAPLLEGLVDVISISLNAPDGARYREICNPAFGQGSFEAVLAFAAECKKHIPQVVFSVVDVLSKEEIAACREIAARMDIPLRVRSCS